MPTKEELEKLGAKMANTLLAELTVLSTVKFQISMNDLLDNIPSEGGFFSHEKDKVTIEPTKEALLEDMLNDKKATIAFCCASLLTDTRLAFDIDHVFPREKITEKQKLLLNYLNNSSNNYFIKAFMGEEPENNDLKKEISKYFKRDPLDGKIKGTKWFIAVCYNDLNNLTHLTHYLNRGKSAETPKKYFEKYFPQQFKKDVEAKGGINEGIIMQQIFSTTVSGIMLDSINFGKVKDKNGKEIGDDVIVYLHEGRGIGLGKFIRQWFKDNANIIIAQSRGIQEINKKLIEMLGSDLQNYGDKEGVKKFILTINQVLKIAEKRNILNNDSSDDSQDTGLVREEVFLQAISWAFDYMHSIKQMKKQFLELVEPSSKDVVKSYIYSSYINQLFSIGDDGIDIALNYLKQQCNALKQESDIRLLTESDAKTLLNNARKEGDPKERVKAAEARAASAEERAVAAERKLADTCGQFGSHPLVPVSAADDVSYPSGQTMGSSMLHGFDNPYSLHNQAIGAERERSASRERSTSQEGERSRSSSPKRKSLKHN